MKKQKQKIISLLVSMLIVVGGCSKTEKKYLPFSTSNGVETEAYGKGSATLIEIKVNPANAQIAKDSFAEFTAVGVYSNGTHQNITSEVTWGTKDTNISEPTGTKGRVNGKVAGSTEVVAKLSELDGKANLTVMPATIVSVQVNCPNSSLAVGTNASCTATAIFSDGTTQDVTSSATWTSGNGTIASVNGGTVTGVGTGNSNITATITIGGQTVISPPNPIQVTPAVLVSIQITGNLNPHLGTVSPLTATGIYSDGSHRDITAQVSWSTGNPSIATQSNNPGTNGYLTPISQGSTYVSANLGGISGSADLTVLAPNLVSVAISSNVTVINGLTYQYTATATYSDGSTQNVTKEAVWNSSNNGVATVTTSLDNGGSLQTVSPGSTTVSATFGGITSNNSNVTVTPATLVSISITCQESLSLVKGLTKTCTATGTYTDGTTADITSSVIWNSSNTGVATISNAEGNAGTATGIGAGNTNITATLNGVTSSVVVLTVTNPTLVSIAITPSSNPSVVKGLTIPFTAIGTYNNGTTVNLTSEVTWNSSNGGVATISNASGSGGVATGTGVGTTNITANFNGVTSNSVSLNGTAATLVSIAITPSSNPLVVKGLTVPFTATGTYTDGSTVDLTSVVTWSSSNTGVATISNASGDKGTATGTGVGTTNIVASLNGTNSNIVTLNGTAATLVSIAVTPNASPSVVVGLTIPFTATGTYTDGSTVNITSSVTWNSSNTTAATISNATDTKGQTTGAGAGSSNITASLGGVTSPAINLTVNAVTLSSISISPIAPSNLVVGGTPQAFVAMGTYNNGQVVDITSSVTWNTTNPTKISISNVADNTKGKATGIASGSSNISASLNGKTSNIVLLSCVDATLLSIVITPNSSPSVVAGLTTPFTAMGTYNNGQTVNITSSVTWSSSDTTKATIDNTATANKGVVTGIAAGSSNISATLNGVTSNIVGLTVNAPTLLSIQIDPPVRSVAKGFTQQFTATGTYNAGGPVNLTNDPNITWTTSDLANTPVTNTVGTKGLVTTGQYSAGTVYVSVSFSGFSGIVTPATLTVTAATLSSIVVTPGNPSIAKGTAQQFIATGIYSDGTTQILTNDPTISWTTTDSNTSISNGVTKGLATTTTSSASTVTVSVTKTGFSGTITPAVLNVTPAVLTKIDITPVTSSIAKGHSKQFVATGTYSDATTQVLTTSASLTWTSSDATNSPISNTLATKGILTTNTNSAASVTVSATYSGFGGTVNPATLTVTAATVASIAVTPSTASIAKNLTQQFIATATMSDGTTQNLTTNASITWTSSNGSSVSVSNATLTKGLATGVDMGTSSVSVTYSPVGGFTGTITPATLAVTTSTTNDITIGACDVSIPTGIDSSGAPTGNFSGTTYNTATNAAGFISQAVDYTTTTQNCAAQGTVILGKILGTNPITASTQNSANTTNFTGGCSITYNLSITTSAARKATELSNALLQSVGLNAVNGSVVVTSLPQYQATETASTSFRAIVQVTYKVGEGGQVVGIGLSNSTDYAANQALLESFLGGTNINCSKTTYLAKTETKTGKADPKVDFVWVVDNSSSMSQEQEEVASATSTFFNKLSLKRIDYRLGVITTGGDGGSSECSNPNSTSGRGESLKGGSWIPKSDTAATTFATRSVVGTSGCGTESGIFYASRSLGGAGGTATVTPRSGYSDWDSDYKLVYIMVSDESDQYRCYSPTAYPLTVNTADDNNVPPCNSSNTAFNYTTSKFKEKNAKVYSIIGLNAQTGLAGKCSTANVAAGSSNNAWTGYYDLSVASGGTVASICSSQYDDIMDTIVNSVAGDSGYVLSKTPQSSSISVKVNGVVVPQSATNGWQYISASNSIVFSGSAWPASGANIEITYKYTSDQGAFLISESGSRLMAFISRTSESNTTRAAAAGIALLIGLILAGRIWLKRK
ncbi:MAG: Ig-like domain-containing protein [Leptospiraceae bacterium]|nr:Ig-like domain-containing protein [Leptospiraceae bacterium]